MSERWEFGEAAAPEPEPGPSPAAHTAGSPRRFPWPPAEEGPVLGAFGETWKSATFDPADFFARIPRAQGTGAALVYYLALVLIVAGAGLFWESLSLFTLDLQDAAMGSGLGGMDAIDPLVGFLLAPAILLVILFVSAGIAHGLLALFGGSRHGFGTSLRVFCYAYSPGLFGVVPILGGAVGSIWMVVLLVIGLARAHETDGWRAALAVLLPFALLLGLVTISMLVVMAAGAALLSA